MTTAGASRRRRWLGTLVQALVCVGASTGLLVVYFWTEHQYTALLVFAVLIPALWAGPLVRQVTELAAGRHFTRTDLALSTHRPRLGETVRALVRLSAKRATTVTRCRAALVGMEEVEVRPGRKERKRAEAFRVETTSETPLQIELGTSAEVELEVTVPADGMESFEGQGATLRWFLEAYATVKGEALIDRQELSVQPRQVGAVTATVAEATEQTIGEAVRIQLTERAFRVGEIAVFSVAMDEDVRRRAGSIAVEVSWRSVVHGREQSPSEEPDEHTVFAGTASVPAAGEAARFEFGVPPAGPMSYAGKLFSVTWRAAAVVHDGDGAELARVEAPLLVLARGPER